MSRPEGMGVIERVYLLAGIALEPLHPGAGRSPGAVDLPVERDIAGYPVVPGSSLKGALKQHCYYTYNCIKKCSAAGNGGGRRGCFNEREGRIDTGALIDLVSRSGGQGEAATDLCDCLLCCCAWGPEPEHGEKGASKFTVTDFVPFAYIARVYIEEGNEGHHAYIYVTSDWLLERLATLLHLAAQLGLTSSSRNIAESLARLAAEASTQSILVTRDHIERCRVRLFLEATGAQVKAEVRRNECIHQLLDEMIARLGVPDGLAANAISHLLILPGGEGTSTIEALLYRRTRVRLLLNTKTVAEGALWTEEYIPPYTLFAGLLIENRFSNDCCNELMKGQCNRSTIRAAPLSPGETTYLQVAGKTSVGAGLLAIHTFERLGGRG